MHQLRANKTKSMNSKIQAQFLPEHVENKAMQYIERRQLTRVVKSHIVSPNIYSFSKHSFLLYASDLDLGLNKFKAKLYLKLLGQKIYFHKY